MATDEDIDDLNMAAILSAINGDEEDGDIEGFESPTNEQLLLSQLQVLTLYEYDHYQPSASSSSSSASSSSSSSSSAASPNIEPLFCQICLEEKQNRHEMIKIQACNHSFCSDCIRQHAEAKIHDKISIVNCPAPNCKSVIEHSAWRQYLSKEMNERYNDVLCELSILDSEKFYCPHPDCSAVLEKDRDEVIMEAECPECRRMFCAMCKVEWHPELSCKEYQNLHKDARESDDLKVVVLAKEKNWVRCNSCNMYVEKNDGCQHITCRCGAEWCYECGEKWATSHYSCKGPSR